MYSQGRCSLLVGLLLFLDWGSTLTSAGAGNDWSYGGEHGPTHWHAVFPTCGGENQSPIHIETHKVFVNHKLTAFEMEGYDQIQNLNMSLKNNGHTVQVDLLGVQPRLRGGGLSRDYQAAQFHFHWGATDDRGSEHALDNKHYPMEMHIVHHSSHYSGLSDAMDKAEGLKVLGFFFEIGEENEQFEKIISHFKEIAHKDDHVEIEAIPLRSLLPSDLSTYYRYQGSLTTPPCYESVIWTVFQETIQISKRQLDIFRHEVKQNLPTEPDIDLTDDFRPIQPLNSRNIYTSNINGRIQQEPVSRPQNSAKVLTVSISYMISLLMFALIRL
ncbi:carbonic anhydrase 14-like isoform X2 [Crassostrea virginica]|uniref:Carbonic anhydrase n=1 Tax=Crassostrea virginica TaxID=6565 RepID=A0A8B8EJ86_CRAVI|nr:carbonic anhydrase 14-like isoform X2 [Crassostrea virginica]